MSLNSLTQLICFNPLGGTLTSDEEAFITQHRIAAFDDSPAMVSAVARRLGVQ